MKNERIIQNINTLNDVYYISSIDINSNNIWVNDFNKKDAQKNFKIFGEK